MKEEIKLAPCPFCGGECVEAIPFIEQPHGFTVQCFTCQASGPHKETREISVEKWNTRTPARLESLRKLQEESEKMGLYGDRRMTEKQRERREFVKAYALAVIGGFFAGGCQGNNSNEAFARMTKGAIESFDILDKQLTGLEKKEGER